MTIGTYELLARVKPHSHVLGYILVNCDTKEVIKLPRAKVGKFFEHNILANGTVSPDVGLLTARPGCHTPIEYNYCIKAYQDNINKQMEGNNEKGKM